MSTPILIGDGSGFIWAKSAAHEFTVTSGALRVTDPCYDMDAWCAGTLENVKNGVWLAEVGYHKDPFDAELSAKRLACDRDELQRDMDRFAKLLADEGVPEAEIAVNLPLAFERQKARLEEREAEMKNHPGRIAHIRICHAEHALDGLPTLDLASYFVAGLHVGVDSGQAGFFDLARYAAQSATELKDARGRFDQQTAHGEFYRQVCALTCETKESFGTLEWGAVSSSGYGDGGYLCHVRRDAAGEVIAAVIVFVDDGEDEEEDEGEAQAAA